MTKPTKWHVWPAKTLISLGISPVWSESLLSAWRKLGSLATHWAYSEDSDQTGQMPRLIWVFPGRIVILSWSSSNCYSLTVLKWFLKTDTWTAIHRLVVPAAFLSSSTSNFLSKNLFSFLFVFMSFFNLNMKLFQDSFLIGTLFSRTFIWFSSKTWDSQDYSIKT